MKDELFGKLKEKRIKILNLTRKHGKKCFYYFFKEKDVLAFLKEHDEELRKIHVKETFKVLKRIDEEQRLRVEQIKKDINENMEIIRKDIVKSSNPEFGFGMKAGLMLAKGFIEKRFEIFSASPKQDEEMLKTEEEIIKELSKGKTIHKGFVGSLAEKTEKKEK